MKLGQKAQDVVTGFKGTITGLCYYITGCNQALLQPKVKADGERLDGAWFDFDRLEITDETPIVLPHTSDGADLPAPIR